jgi:hypothetical protein
MFDQEYINCGKLIFTDTAVHVYKNYYDNRNLNNIPGGRIRAAYWQGNHINVVMDSGKTYVYNDFNGWSMYY